MKSRIYKQFKQEVVPKIKEEFKLGNISEVPSLRKIVLNAGVGEAISDIKELDHVVENLKVITGQAPRINRAKKAIAAFKIRKGMPVGTSVTLRRDMMYEFFDRMVNVAMPRIRDFRGLSTSSFDGRGNYNFGIQEHIIFPEINIDKVKRVFGFDVTIVTNAPTDDMAKRLLELMGFPFKREASTVK